MSFVSIVVGAAMAARIVVPVANQPDPILIKTFTIQHISACFARAADKVNRRTSPFAVLPDFIPHSDRGYLKNKNFSFSCQLSSDGHMAMLKSYRPIDDSKHSQDEAGSVELTISTVDRGIAIAAGQRVCLPTLPWRPKLSPNKSYGQLQQLSCSSHQITPDAGMMKRVKTGFNAAWTRLNY